MPASLQAIAAVRAAKNFRRWGPDATTRYLQNNDVDADLFWAALMFEGRRKS